MGGANSATPSIFGDDGRSIEVDDVQRARLATVH